MNRFRFGRGVQILPQPDGARLSLRTKKVEVGPTPASRLDQSPKILGNPSVGELLVYEAATWTETPVAVNWVWISGGAPAAIDTATYSVGPDDMGRTIYLVERARFADGYTENAPAQPVTP